MLEVGDSVSEIPFIGDKYEKLLLKLNIKTVKDLLYHFPFRYDDFSKLKKISELKLNDTVTVTGIIESINNVFTKNGKKFTKIVLSDETGKINCIWFNQPFLAKTFYKGLKISVSGTVSFFDRSLTFISPEFEFGNNIHTGRIVPIYPETYGVSSKWLRSRINHLLTISEMKIEEYLPKNILSENNFLEINSSLNQIHFPSNLKKSQLAKSRFEYEEILEILLNSFVKKGEWGNKKCVKLFSNCKLQISNFIKNLPFNLTNSQLQCVNEIIEDLTKEKPMNRILQGDVGSGKTVVAVIASYLAYLNNSKTYYMAPTEVLANQHFETFKNLFANTKVKLGLTTGSQKHIGEFDIEIGTHALLHKENNKNAGLVIIDEQHKFGVEQRATLTNITEEKTAHLLTMTATPIPRTLALTLYGDLDISSLTEKPIGRQKITTKVVTKTQREKAYEWIKNELSKSKKQAYIVCPLIEESEHESLANVKAATIEFEKLSKNIFKDFKVALLHGRMKPKEKEEVLNGFRNGESQILVATPVIEVGIDIKNVTVIAIEASERFGLAQLHQMRGRVGRGEEKSYCLLLTESSNPQTISRLKLLETEDEGSKLAEYDLKLRGQGEIFGTAQSGMIRLKLADISNIELIKKVKEDLIKTVKNTEDFNLLKTHFVSTKNVSAN